MYYYSMPLQEHSVLSRVEFYTIIIDPAITPSVVLFTSMTCNGEGCHHALDFSSLQFNHRVAYISVKITAHNAVGMSQPGLCNPQFIGELSTFSSTLYT